MKLVLAALAVLMLAFLTAEYRLRPIALGSAFLLRIGFPSVFSGTVLSGLHLSTLLVFAYAFIWPLAAPKATSKAENRLPQIPLLCHAALGTVAVGTVAMSGSWSAASYAGTLTLNQLVAPYIFCMLIYGASNHVESLSKDAGRLFALVCVFEALIALLVFERILPQPFQSSFSTIAYWASLGTRQAATLDHPLCLGVLLAAGIPMVAYFNSSLIAVVSATTMVVGIALTQSRIAASAALIGFLYLGVFRIRSNVRRLGSMAVGGLIFAVGLNIGVFTDLIDRIGDDSGSSLVRTRSWQFFLDTWSNFAAVGDGMESSRDYFILNGFRASGESAAVAYAVGIGIPLTLVYLFLIAWLIAYGVRKSIKLTPSSVAAIVTFISIQLFSSISTESAVGMILWATIGISLASPRIASVLSVQNAKTERARTTRFPQRSVPMAGRSPAAGVLQEPNKGSAVVIREEPPSAW